MKQRDKLLKIMLTYPNKKVWYAKDFQTAPCFIGYEATARMSEVADIYSDIIITGKDGRFRTLSVDWSKEKEVQDIKTILEEIDDGETN